MAITDKPEVTVEQQLEDTTVSVSSNEQNAVILGPAYNIIDNETHTGSSIYDGTSTTLSYTDKNAGEVVDTRIVDADDDELMYPVQVTLKDAKILKASGESGGTILANTNKLDGIDLSSYTDYEGVVKIDVTSATMRHTLPTPVSIDNTGPSYTITFDEPVALDIDIGKTYYNPANALADPDPDITVISTDRKTITVNAAFTDDSIVSGHYIEGSAASDELREYTLTEIDDDTQAIAGIPASVKYTLVAGDIYEYLDVEYTDPTAHTQAFTIGTDGVTIPASLTDADGNTISSCDDIRLKYRALKTALAENLTRIDISDYSNEIASKLGEINKYNTGGYAAYAACKNTTIDVYFVGVDSTWFTNKSGAIIEAESFYRDETAGYHVVALSQKDAVNDAINSHVSFVSTSDQGNWRVAYFAPKLVTHEAVVDSTSGAAEGQTETLFTDSNATFSSDGVQPTDKVMFNSWGDVTLGASRDTWTATINDVSTYDAATGIFDVDADLSAGGAISIGDLVGRHIKISGASAIDNTSSDANSYYDKDHPSGNNGQTFAELGYRVSAAEVTGASHTVLTLEGVGTGTVLSGTATAAWDLDIHDGLLSKQEEDTLIRDGLTVDLVSGENNLSTTEGIKNWGTASSPDWHQATYCEVDYEVRDLMSKDEQAAYIAAYTTSFADKRMRAVWPGTLEDATGTELPGYFLAAATAGKYSSMVPQASLTRSYVNSEHKALYTNGYFKDAQLQIIADGGATIFTQTVDGANLKCRRQESTDTSSLLYLEPSIIHAVDFTCVLVKKALDELVGNYNITQALFDAASFKLEGVKSRVTKKESKWGGIVKRFKLISMDVDSTETDHVAVEIELNANYPCNGFNVTITTK